MMNSLSSIEPTRSKPTMQHWEALNNNNTQLIRLDIGEPEITDEQRRSVLSITRGLYRNDMFISGLINTIAEFAVGKDGGKINILSKDTEFNTVATKYFNKVFYKNCIYNNPNKTLNDALRIITMTAEDIDGDILIWIHQNIGNKIMMFAADQLVNLDAKTYEAQAINKGFFDEVDGKKIVWKHKAGMLLDNYGMVKKWIVTHNIGKTNYKFEDVNILDAKDCYLVSNDYRPNQLRGVPNMLCCTEVLDSLKDSIKSETRTLQNISQMGLIIKRDEPWIAAQEYCAKHNLDIDDLTSEQRTQLLDKFTNDDEDFKKGWGGLITTMGSKDSMEVLNANNRPNNGIVDYVTWLQRNIGKRLGVYSLMALGLADKSYSASRSEIMLTWRLLENRQKKLERLIVDNLAVKYINGLIKDGTIKKPTDDDWQDAIIVCWPTCPQIDPVKEETATKIKLETGKIHYIDILGPNWKQIVDQRAECEAYIKSKGLTIGVANTTNTSTNNVDNIDNEDDNADDTDNADTSNTNNTSNTDGEQ